MRLAWKLCIGITAGSSGLMALIALIILLARLLSAQGASPAMQNLPPVSAIAAASGVLLALALCGTLGIILRQRRPGAILLIVHALGLCLLGAAWLLGMIIAARSSGGEGAFALGIVSGIGLLLALAGVWNLLSATHPLAPPWQRSTQAVSAE
ncbi:MAG: hypothetical protein K1X75_16755 [Leptospirales bacterium]|nr:hypothetical protein [Leptospirales bacterium]